MLRLRSFRRSSAHAPLVSFDRLLFSCGWRLPPLSSSSGRAHGFRAGYQAAELQLLVRMIIDKRLEWSVPVFLAKLDIAKASDTVDWPATNWLFERRQLPLALRSAYWRVHYNRELTFHLGDGLISFPLRPCGGMPQGAPESPLVYAALVEELLQIAVATLTCLPDAALAGFRPVRMWRELALIRCEYRDFTRWASFRAVDRRRQDCGRPDRER